MKKEVSISTDLLDDSTYPGSLFPLIRSAGFTYIHWCQDWNSMRMYSDQEITRIAFDVEKNDLRVCDLHASHGKNQFLLLSELEKNRSAALALLENRMLLVKALGGDTVVLHLDPNLVIDVSEETPMHQKSNVTPKAELIDRVLSVSEALNTLCCKHTVRIAFENLRDVPSFNTKTLMPFVKRLDPRWFGFCFDTGHANLTGFDTLDTQLFLSRMISIHLSDNFGTKDDHMIPFTASIDWNKAMDMIGRSSYTGPLTLEVSYPFFAARSPKAVASFLSEAYRAATKLTNMLQLHR